MEEASKPAKRSPAAWIAAGVAVLALAALPAGYQKATGNHVRIVFFRKLWTWPLPSRTLSGVTPDGRAAWIDLRGPLVISSASLPLPENGTCRVIHRSAGRGPLPAAGVPTIVLP